MDPIIKAALEARTRGDVDHLEDLLRRALKGERLRMLGDQEANWSSISSPADPTSVLFERATNMFDADIELEAERQGMRGCTSPAEAAHTFFRVPREGVGEMTQGERQKIAVLSQISVLDSDEPVHHPTIAFRDKGIGLTTAQVPDTILSLQRSNKLRKPYTNGVFGKGGSSASAFSDATVIVTRRNPDLLAAGEEDRITVAVVREADAPDVGLPFYRYLVGSDDLPYSVPASSYPQFVPGTYVAHINYWAGRMGQQNWQFEESIYAYAETILFNPTLPYLLDDGRTGSANVRPDERQKPTVLSGLSQRLEQLQPGDDNILGRSGWQSIPIAGVGNVRLRWWLFCDPDRRRRRAAKGYVVVFTTNGQIHHAWDQARLQQLVEGRTRVSRQIFVHVDCDAIELKLRYKVFDSFRAQIRKGPEGRALEDAVAFALANDADLNDYESDLIREALKSASRNVSQQFRRRLNRALRSKIPGLAPAEGQGKGPKPPKPKKQADLYPEPTTMTGPAEMTLQLGRPATVYLEINASDGFVPDRGEITLEATNGGPVPLIGVGDLRQGRLRLSLEAVAGMAEGERTFDIVLQWLRDRGGLGRIEWPLRVNVVAKLEPKPAQPPKPKTGTAGASKDGEVAFIWVAGDTEGWTDEMVGELQQIRGDDLAARNQTTYGDLKGVDALIPTIVLNQNFGDWAAYKRSIAKRASDDTLRTREDRYGLAVGVTVANLALHERKLRSKHDAWEVKPNGSEPPPAPMTPEQLHRAGAEAARGVLALMPDFDVILGDLAEQAGSAA